MKTIASLKGPEFLRACNRTRHAVSDFLAETKVLDLRKVMPEIPADSTAEQQKELLRKQNRTNLSAMLDRMLDEYPDKTYDLLCTMIVPEEGEELDGIALLNAGMDLLYDDRIVDFFIKLMGLVQTTTED